jgi:hypothetical protein
MKIALQLPAPILDEVQTDLSRPHSFAAERVGFLLCSAYSPAYRSLVLVANRWMPVSDDHYLDNPRVGACIGPAAFRKVLAAVHMSRESVIHVHRHEHRGTPAFSQIDMRSMSEFVPSFFNASPLTPHGAIVLSHDSATGAIWESRDDRPKQFSRFQIVNTSGN